MSRSVGAAYGIAGAAVAAAIIVIAGATTGFDESAVDSASTNVVTQQALPDGVTLAGTSTAAAQIVTGPNGEQVEYVYVDQPTSWRDDDDHEDHEDDDEHDDDEHDDDEHDDDEHEDDD